jgi:hypothetical protein
MSDVEDILAYAWNKDAVNLGPAIDAVMSAKAAAAIQDMTSTVAASLFGQEAPVGNEEEPLADSTDDFSDQPVEEPTDENV